MSDHENSEPEQPGLVLEFHTDLTLEQIRISLRALNDYYIACGGAGFTFSVMECEENDDEG